MDIIFNHGGFFISVGVIMLLALIGYYADRNDSKKKSNSTSSSSIEQSVGGQYDNDVELGLSLTESVPLHDANLSDYGESSNNLVEEADDLDNDEVVQDNVEFKQSGVESNDFSDSGLSVGSFKESDYENIDMSLEDLENNKNDGFVDNSVSDVDGVSSYGVGIDTDLNSELVDDKSSDISMINGESDSISKNVDNEYSDKSDSVVDNIDNGYSDESDLINYGFDNEVDSTSSNLASDEFGSDKLDDSEFVDGDSEGSDYNASLDSDIWKF